MKKIPIKIIQVTSPSGDTKKGAILDSQYYFQMEENSRDSIKEFEKLYFQKVKEAKKLFFGTNLETTKKKQDVPSSVYWKLGKLFLKFDEAIKNKYTITNYAEALERDFGLSKDYVYDLLTIAELIKKKDIFDEVPFSYYRALKRKSNPLKKLGIFDQELKRLNKMGLDGNLPGREPYKIELIKIIESKRRKK